ncbi:MAG TPA: stage V sporulation protein AD, partial [Clostridiales bacterium]|nr:stage V sporulation protein AD [Clostridiales bacterium]
VSVTLIFLGVLLTGLNIYPKLAKYAGAGTIVPITGFANSVAAPSIEARTEGFVLGVGAKLFTIAGPVIVYGIGASFLAGIWYFIKTL